MSDTIQKLRELAANCCTAEEHDAQQIITEGADELTALRARVAELEDQLAASQNAHLYMADREKSLADRVAELEVRGNAFLDAVERLGDWMNGNDLSADHADQKPDDFQKLCDEMVAFRAALAGRNQDGND